MKLQQGQTWQQGNEYIRIVHLERLDVEYKVIKDLATKYGTHHHVMKKDFCRLIKKAVLLPSTPKQSEERTPAIANEKSPVAEVNAAPAEESGAVAPIVPAPVNPG